MLVLQGLAEAHFSNSRSLVEDLVLRELEVVVRIMASKVKNSCEPRWELVYAFFYAKLSIYDCKTTDHQSPDFAPEGVNMGRCVGNASTYVSTPLALEWSTRRVILVIRKCNPDYILAASGRGNLFDGSRIRMAVTLLPLSFVLSGAYNSKSACLDLVPRRSEEFGLAQFFFFFSMLSCGGQKSLFA